jgi:hypothetical protein
MMNQEEPLEKTTDGWTLTVLVPESTLSSCPSS